MLAGFTGFLRENRCENWECLHDFGQATVEALAFGGLGR